MNELTVPNEILMSAMTAIRFATLQFESTLGDESKKDFEKGLSILYESNILEVSENINFVEPLRLIELSLKTLFERMGGLPEGFEFNMDFTGAGKGAIKGEEEGGRTCFIVKGGKKKVSRFYVFIQFLCSKLEDSLREDEEGKKHLEISNKKMESIKRKVDCDFKDGVEYFIILESIKNLVDDFFEKDVVTFENLSEKEAELVTFWKKYGMWKKK
jgi:hypothetical protein